MTQILKVGFYMVAIRLQRAAKLHVALKFRLTCALLCSCVIAMVTTICQNEVSRDSCTAMRGAEVAVEIVDVETDLTQEHGSQEEADSEQSSTTNEHNLYANVRTLACVLRAILTLFEAFTSVAGDSAAFGRIAESFSEATLHLRRVRDARDIATRVERDDTSAVATSSRTARNQSTCGV